MILFNNIEKVDDLNRLVNILINISKKKLISNKKIINIIFNDTL